MGSNRRPHFFQIYTFLISDRLEIPKPCLKHLKDVTSGSTCNLMGPSEKVWTVKLIKDGAGLFLEEGWSVFVKDHYIKFGDFLVFRWDESWHFEVMIFGKNGCLKESSFSAVCSQVASIVTANGKKKANQTEHDIWDSTEVAVQVTSTTNGKKKANQAKHDGGNSTEEAVQVICTTNGKKKANQTKYSRWDFLPMEEAVAEAADRRGSLLSQRRPVTLNETEKAKEAANKFTSENPSFIIVMRASHVYFGFCVTVPGPVWRAKLPKRGQEMILWDPRGRAWSVHYRIVGKIRAVFSKGWVAFTENNNIEADDVCVFEVIQKNQIKVHIFRVVEEVRPLIKNTSKFRKGKLLTL